MPHLVLETTSNLAGNANLPEILAALVERLASFPSVDAASIKAYHTLRPVWAMGEGASEGFAHLEVRLLTGRSDELRTEIANGLMAVLAEAFTDSVECAEAGLTLEVREMDRLTYRKSGAVKH